MATSKLVGDGDYDFRGIPKDIIFGRVRKFISVHRAYKAKYVQSFLQQLNDAYWAKTKRYGYDNLGNHWTALKARTHEIKNNEATLTPKSNPHISGEYTSPRILSPKQLKEYRKVRGNVNLADTPDRNARKRLDRALTKQGLSMVYTPWYGDNEPPTITYFGKEIPQTPKMVRTGRLVAATQPGPIVNNRHYSSKDLTVNVVDNKIQISLANIPYAEAADEERPIIPTNCGPWELHAHNDAIKEALTVYNNIRGNEATLGDDDDRFTLNG